jgi:rhomboid protease GluP
MRFARAVLNRSYLFTILFLIANFFVFLLMWQSNGMSSNALWAAFTQPVLLAYGAKLNSLIRQDREWWRLVTPIFIHVNLIHLLVNMYSLWMIGPYVEKLYGSAKFVVFWVVTGVAGVVASYLTVRPDMVNSLVGSFIFKVRDDPSAGASGALFGLIGVLFVFGIKFRRELPEGFKRAFGTGLLPLILINLFIGFMGRGFIDNAAHLGGLASGAALALVVDYKRPGERATITITWRTLQILALALVCVSFVMVARHRHGSYPVGTNLTEQENNNSPEAIVSYLESLNNGTKAFANTLNLELEPQAAEQVARTLDAGPAPDQQSDLLRKELKTLLLRAIEWEKVAPSQRTQPQQREQLKKLYEDFEAWIKKRDEWVNLQGAKYGIKLVAPEDANSVNRIEAKPSPAPASPVKK